MQINDVKREHPSAKEKIIGRGGKRGQTSGRGTKGQKARAGHKIRPDFRDTLKKLPKLRGYKVKIFAVKPFVLNLGTLDREVEDGAIINPKVLVEMGLAKKKNGQIPQIKILGRGAITKKLIIAGCSVSAAAKGAIEKTGGRVN